MHKKGVTEEVAKKRSRRTVKHQRGIVGADLATIAARRNQTAAERQKQRLAAISRAKTEKKEKESKKVKVCVQQLVSFPPRFKMFSLHALSLHPDPRYQSNRWREGKVDDNFRCLLYRCHPMLTPRYICYELLLLTDCQKAGYDTHTSEMVHKMFELIWCCIAQISSKRQGVRLTLLCVDSTTGIEKEWREVYGLHNVIFPLPLRWRQQLWQLWQIWPRQ